MAKFQTATLAITFSKAVKNNEDDNLDIEPVLSVDQLQQVLDSLIEDPSIIIEVAMVTE